MEQIEYWQFEPAVEDAIRRCIVGDETVQKDFKKPDAKHYNRVHADFYLEKGCKALDMNEPFIIEAKYTLRYDSMRMIRMLYEAFGLPLIIVVLDERSKGLFINPEIYRDVKILTLNELRDKAKLINRDNIDKIQPTEVTIDELKSVFYHGNITLFLGAGVSASAKMPTWNNLIERFLKELNINAFNSDDYPALSASVGHSPIISARYITSIAKEKGLDEAHQATALRNALYDRGKKYTSDLLNSIVALCTKHVNRVRIVKSIITLNYDDLVEQHLKKRNIQFASLYESGIPEINQLPIIHAHGILQQDKQIIDFMPVLAEQKYHELYLQSYTWSNVDILHALQRTTCIFIGMSMLDPNLRRLLEFANSYSGKALCHYAILPHKNLAKHNWDSPNPTKYYTTTPDKETDFKNLESETLSELGVKVLWYEDGDYAKVPEYLNRIAQA